MLYSYLVFRSFLSVGSQYLLRLLCSCVFLLQNLSLLNFSICMRMFTLFVGIKCSLFLFWNLQLVSYLYFNIFSFAFVSDNWYLFLSNFFLLHVYPVEFDIYFFLISSIFTSFRFDTACGVFQYLSHYSLYIFLEVLVCLP